MQKLMSGFAAAALLVALPMTANAQDAVTVEGEMETQDVCNVSLAPIHASESVAVTGTFDAPFGEIVEIETPAESGLSLITEDKSEMANELSVEGTVEARTDAEGDIEAEANIEQRAPLAGETENVSTFWLNASEAAAGSYTITLINEAGERCTTELTIEEKIEMETETESAMDEVEEEVEEELEDELEEVQEDLEDEEDES